MTDFKKLCEKYKISKADKKVLLSCLKETSVAPTKEPSIIDISLMAFSDKAQEAKRALDMVHEFFLKPPLPEEALRNAQVAIAYLNFRQAGAEIIKQVLEDIGHTLGARAEIEHIKARTEAQIKTDESKVKVIKAVGVDAFVTVGGKKVLIADMQTIIDQLPPQLITLLLAKIQTYGDSTESNSEVVEDPQLPATNEDPVYGEEDSQPTDPIVVTSEPVGDLPDDKLNDSEDPTDGPETIQQ